MANYTDKMFFEDVADLLTGEVALEELPTDSMMEKVEAKLAQLEKRKEYAATHKKPAKAKGPSDATKARADQIAAILSAEPLTTAEINQVLGTNYSALQVSSAMKFVDNVKTQKVIRMTEDSKGMKAEKPYTAYFIG